MQAGGQVKFCNEPPTPHLPPLPPSQGVQTNGACPEAIFSCDDHAVSSLGGMTIKNRDINLIMRLTVGLMSWRNMDTDPTRRKYSTFLSLTPHSGNSLHLPEFYLEYSRVIVTHTCVLLFLKSVTWRCLAPVSLCSAT